MDAYARLHRGHLHWLRRRRRPGWQRLHAFARRQWRASGCLQRCGPELNQLQRPFLSVPASSLFHGKLINFATLLLPTGISVSLLCSSSILMPHNLIDSTYLSLQCHAHQARRELYRTVLRSSPLDCSGKTFVSSGSVTNDGLHGKRQYETARRLKSAKPEAEQLLTCVVGKQTSVRVERRISACKAHARGLCSVVLLQTADP